MLDFFFFLSVDDAGPDMTKGTDALENAGRTPGEPAGTHEAECTRR